VSAVEERMADLDRAFEALEHTDLDAFMAIVQQSSTPDLEFHSAISEALGGGTFRGVKEVRRWFADLLETIDHPRFRDRHYEVVDENAFLFFASYDMRSSAGMAMNMELGQLYELEDGLLKRATGYSSHAEAREAAERLHA
jgi:hypothetical protein